jgi:Bacteriocin-protection, YdeI or OmpD-Associated
MMRFRAYVEPVTEPADFAPRPGRRPGCPRRLAYNHKREHVLAIESAKKPETRARRIEKALAMLRDGHGR